MIVQIPENNSGFRDPNTDPQRITIMTTMKLNKTEQKLVDRARGGFFPGQSSVEAGLHRGRGGTGKLRRFGVRERNALKSLVDKGIVEIIDATTTNHSWRGYGTTHTNLTYRLKG